MNKNSIPTKEYIIYLLILIGFITSCKKEDVNEPTNSGQTKKYHIANFEFGPNYKLHPTAEQIDSAFKAGADSIYLNSTNNWNCYTYNGNTFIPSVNTFNKAAENLTNMSGNGGNGTRNPRVVGKGTINPDDSVANDIQQNVIDIFTAYGFKYEPESRQY